MLTLIICFVLLMLCSSSVFSQYQSTTQSLVRQEFFNPAYNSFKDYYSFSTLSRWQWADVAYSPRTYALSAYLPINNSTFGLGPTIIKENIGLRNILTFYGSASHNVKLTRNSFLAFGLGVGFESSTYDKEKLRTYLGADLYGVDYSRIDPAISIGIMYLSAKYFLGLSTNTVFRGSASGNTLPGFDFTGGAMFALNNNLGFKPCVVLKYYKEGSVPADGLYNSASYGELIADVSANFFINNSIWLGTSHRFKQAQTFSLDLEVLKDVSFGYTFEWGIGSGLNQYSSHGIRLALDIRSSKRKKVRTGGSYLRNRIPILYL